MKELCAILGAALLLLLLAGCGTITTVFTEDGCALIGQETERGRVLAGICQDGRRVVEWQAEQPDGSQVRVRATRMPEGGAFVVQYFAGGGWILWSSKSGVAIGPIPAGLAPEA